MGKTDSQTDRKEGAVGEEVCSKGLGDCEAVGEASLPGGSRGRYQRREHWGQASVAEEDAVVEVGGRLRRLRGPRRGRK